MKKDEFDVVIVGAGLVGLALAPPLARAGLKVALVDRARVAAPQYDPATWDTRVFAISPGSATYLRALGAWQMLEPARIAPIETMHVAGDAGATIEFSAYELGERALAWIVEERALRESLLPLVFEAGVDVIGEATLTSLDWTPAAGTLTLAAADEPVRALSAKLVVGADGARSWVRQAAGIVAMDKPYGQTAVVANFAVRARAPWRRQAMVSHRWQRARVVAVARAPTIHGVVRARCPGRGTLGPRCGDPCRTCSPGRRPRPGRHVSRDRGSLLSTGIPEAADDDCAPPGAGGRCGTRRPSTGRAGRQPRVRRCRGAGGDLGRARSGCRPGCPSAAGTVCAAAGRTRSGHAGRHGRAGPAVRADYPVDASICAMPA